MVVRKRRVSFWFVVAMLALMSNPFVWRLVLNLCLAGVKFLGSDLPLP